jgi:alkanesulfonate monooxygenase SsuD/methylene tetrahydromethanopterin reductase-like flavin-dependent oxidoreductase (luciferase family)
MQRGGVHWGLSLPNRGVLFGATTVEELLELARIGEASGFFGSIWVGDSLLDRPRIESLVFMGALAAVTRRVGIGVSCFASLVVRHPIHLAVQWASIDVLSGGRTIWVACLGGGVARELEPFGIRRRDRVPRLKETLELIRRFWTEDEVDYEGRFFKFTGVRVEPKPVQRPHPPIWYAVTPDVEKLPPGAVDRALQRAVDYADGWQGADTDAAQLGRLCRRVQELARSRGYSNDHPFPCSTHVHITIDDDKDRAWATSKWYFNEYYPEDFVTGRGPIPEALIRRFHTWGPPEECARGLLAYARQGCSTIIVRFAARDQITQLRRFLEDVAPILEREAPPVQSVGRSDRQA